MILSEVASYLMEHSVTEADKTSSVQNQIVLKKIQAINRTIQNLLNKKIRIDLEIKKQKTVLKNYQKQASKDLKLKVALEQYSQLQRIFESCQLDPPPKEDNPEYILETLDGNIQTIQELETQGAFDYLQK